ncbi:LamG domain-containing protein, partial [Candidatus Woesebacteria bacterium]|nr:LamG domain-containing protein [Candidatus Woesebacteria bacterium]
NATTNCFSAIATTTDTYIGQNFTGKLDETKVYDYARTPAQIAWEYNQGAPIAWYKLDECQGTTAYNSAKNGNGDAAGNNGTITIGATGSNTSAGTCAGSAGQAWFDGATGKIGSSLEFDGTNDYVEINSLLGTPTNISISAWVNIQAIDTTSAEIVNIGNYVDLRGFQSGYGGFQCNYYKGGAAWNTIANGGTPNYTGTGWHHVACVIDDVANVQNLFVDGKIVFTGSYTESIVWSGLQSTTLLGKHPTSGSFDFNGQLDDVRIFNYALTSAQVNDVYNNGAVSFK